MAALRTGSCFVEENVEFESAFKIEEGFPFVGFGSGFLLEFSEIQAERLSNSAKVGGAEIVEFEGGFEDIKLLLSKVETGFEIISVGGGMFELVLQAWISKQLGQLL